MTATAPSDRLVAGAVDTLHAWYELGNEVSAGGGATLVRAGDCPQVYDANCAVRVRAAGPAEIDGLLDGLERHFRGLGHRCVKADPLTPAPVEARLALLGYTPTVELQLVLSGDLRPGTAAPTVDIRPALSDADWGSLSRLMTDDHRETFARRDQALDDGLAAQLNLVKRRKAPAVQYFLAAADGTDCAYCAAWPGVGGIGKVEDLYTAPDFRRRGIASALVAHCVADARRRGAGPVLIGADPDDTPRHMYAALGFQPLLLYRSWVRTGPS